MTVASRARMTHRAPGRSVPVLLDDLLTGIPLGTEGPMLTGVPLNAKDPLAGLPRIGSGSHVLGWASPGLAQGPERVVHGGHGG